MKRTILALIILAGGINARAQTKIVVEKTLSIRNAFEAASERLHRVEICGQSDIGGETIVARHVVADAFEIGS